MDMLKTQKIVSTNLSPLPPVNTSEVVLTGLAIAGLVSGIALSGAKKMGEASVAIAAGTFFYGLLRKMDQRKI